MLNAESIFSQPLHGLRIDAVFKGQDALRSRILVITGIYRYRSLNDQRAVIQLFINKVHSGSAEAHSVIRRLLLSLQTREAGQQGGVDIQDSLRKGMDECRAYQAHIPGQAHGPDTEILQDANYCPIVGLSGGVFRLRNNPDGDAMLLGPLQAFDFGHVGDHHLNAGLQDPLLNAIDKGLQVGSAPGNEDCYGKRHMEVFSVRSSALPPASLKYFLGQSAQKNEFAGKKQSSLTSILN